MGSLVRDYVDIANQYIDDVLSGKVLACTLVKQACQRQLDDLARENTDDFPYVFAKRPKCKWCGDGPDPTCRKCQGSGLERYDPAIRVCKFIENLPHIEGDWASATVVLEPWQCFSLTTRSEEHTSELQSLR